MTTTTAAATTSSTQRQWAFLGEGALPADPIARRHEKRGRRWLVVSYVFCPCHIPLILALVGAAFGGSTIGSRPQRQRPGSRHRPHRHLRSRALAGLPPDPPGQTDRSRQRHPDLHTSRLRHHHPHQPVHGRRCRRVIRHCCDAGGRLDPPRTDLASPNDQRDTR